MVACACQVAWLHALRGLCSQLAHAFRRLAISWVVCDAACVVRSMCDTCVIGLVVGWPKAWPVVPVSWLCHSDRVVRMKQPSTLHLQLCAVVVRLPAHLAGTAILLLQQARGSPHLVTAPHHTLRTACDYSVGRLSHMCSCAAVWQHCVVGGWEALDHCCGRWEPKVGAYVVCRGLCTLAAGLNLLYHIIPGGHILLTHAVHAVHRQTCGGCTQR